MKHTRSAAWFRQTGAFEGLAARKRDFLLIKSGEKTLRRKAAV